MEKYIRYFRESTVDNKMTKFHEDLLFTRFLRVKCKKGTPSIEHHTHPSIHNLPVVYMAVLLNGFE